MDELLPYDIVRYKGDDPAWLGVVIRRDGTQVRVLMRKATLPVASSPGEVRVWEDSFFEDLLERIGTLRGSGDRSTVEAARRLVETAISMRAISGNVAEQLAAELSASKDPSRDG